MPRARSKARIEDDILDTVDGIKAPPRVAEPRERRADNSDPREPLPFGETEPTGVVTTMDEANRKTSERLFSVYARALIANNGDVVLALADTFGITREEAQMNMVALHERARGASRMSTSISDMLERHDMTTETRIVALRPLLFSDAPAVVLKTVDMLNEMDATAKSKRIGTTWEVLVARVRAGAGPKATAERQALPAKRKTLEA